MRERDPAFAPLIGASAEVVYQLAVRDPLAVTRALARALRHQTAGAKSTAVRILAEAMEASEPGCMAQVAGELARRYVERPSNAA
jgi:hypothetical protein